MTRSGAKRNDGLKGWCRRPGLNWGPTDYESVALPLSYVGRGALIPAGMAGCNRIARVLRGMRCPRNVTGGATFRGPMLDAAQFSFAGPASTARACPECGLFQYVPPLRPGQIAECDRCDARLRRRRRDSLDVTLALNVAGVVLFCVAAAFPLLGLDVAGQQRATTLLRLPGRVFGKWHLAVGDGRVRHDVGGTAVEVVADHRRDHGVAPGLAAPRSSRPWRGCGRSLRRGR